MDAHELKALLEATSRELTAVGSALFPPDSPMSQDLDAEVLRDAMAEARQATEDAVSEVVSRSSSAGIGLETDTMREARALGTAAARERDAADAQLWALRSERDVLLARFQNLTEDREQGAETRLKENDDRAQREGVLQERCGKLDEEVVALRRCVEARARRLLALSNEGHSLNLNKRRLQRKHSDAVAENRVARDILELQRCAKAYLDGLRIGHEEVDDALTEAQSRYVDQLAFVQEEWRKKQDEYQAEAEALEARLVQLMREYEEQWQAIDTDAKQRLAETEAQRADARQSFEHHVVELDGVREKERADARDKVQQLRLTVEQARQQLASELNSRFDEKQVELSFTMERHQRQCNAMRSKIQRRITTLSAEVKHFQGLLREVSESYRGGGFRRQVPPPFRRSQSPPLSALSATQSLRGGLGGTGFPPPTPMALTPKVDDASRRLETPKSQSPRSLLAV
mmetsp:Transcript_107842/g.303861  ORF Transcript_107842/g.303861 Transcript_107842/m.303861 type:complete len:460 (+) Transcript_107842:98-1477(+)